MKSSDRTARITTLCSPKGGVGRTTVTVALAAALTRRGARTLVLDLDPKGHTSFWLLGERSDHGASLMATLLDARPLRSTTAHDVDVVAGGSRARNGLTQMDTILGRARFERALDPMRELYDHILIDTPPRGVERILPAMTVSHTTLIPVRSCIYSEIDAMTVAAQLEHLRAEGMKLPARLGCVMSQPPTEALPVDELIPWVTGDARIHLIEPIIPYHDDFHLSVHHTDPALLFRNEDVARRLDELADAFDALTRKATDNGMGS